MAKFSSKRYPLAADGDRSGEEWHKVMKAVRLHVEQALDYVRVISHASTDEQLAEATGCNFKTLSALRNNPESCMRATVEKLCMAAHTNIVFLQHGGGFYESCDLWDGEAVRTMYEAADKDIQREITAILKRHHLAKLKDVKNEIALRELQKHVYDGVCF